MVLTIQEEKKELIDFLVTRGYIKNEMVKLAFLNVERENFVPDHLKSQAYRDTPLPIGWGQTISAPSMIAIMLEVSEFEPGMKVLEIGAGSGYNAALIAEICGDTNVTTIERVYEVYEFGRNNLEKEGYKVKIIHGDGTKGYEEDSPYDRIIVTAASPDILPSWKNQTKVGGKIIAPVGRERYYQELLVSEKKSDDSFKTIKHGGCVFVPLIGENGWKD